MATYSVHDAYYNNQHVYFWGGDAVVAVPKLPISGGRMFRRFFYTVVVIGLTWTITNHTAEIRSLATSVYNYCFPVQPVSPLARTLLDLLAEPDLWRIEDNQLKLRDGGIFGLNENGVGGKGDICLTVDSKDRTHLLSEHDRKTILPAYQRVHQVVTDREARAVADRIALPRYRTSQCAFPSPPAPEAVTLPSPAAVGVALPPADAKENPCTERSPKPTLPQRSSSWAAGPRR